MLEHVRHGKVFEHRTPPRVGVLEIFNHGFVNVQVLLQQVFNLASGAVREECVRHRFVEDPTGVSTVGR